MRIGLLFLIIITLVVLLLLHDLSLLMHNAIHMKGLMP